MAAVFQPLPLLLLLLSLLFFFSLLPLSSSQSNSPQNIETFFPFESFPPPPVVITPNSPSLPSPNNTPNSTTQVLATPPVSSSRKSSHRTIVKAVAATAATTLVIAGVFFFFLHRFAIARRRRLRQSEMVSSRENAIPHDEFKRFDGTLKGLIVDENGLDVLYWRKLEGVQLKKSFRKEVLSRGSDDQDSRRVDRINQRSKSEPIQEIPLLRGKSSSSSAQIRPDLENPSGIRAFRTDGFVREAVAVANSVSSNPPPSPLPPPPPPPPPPPRPPQPPRPPPPPAIPVKKNPAPPPPPPPIPAKKNPAPPPPPLLVGGLASSSKPPPAPKANRAEPSSTESLPRADAGQTKLKPLHWDKLTAKADHSMVWDKINDGSFRFDDDLMEALFGYVATNRKSPERNNPKSNTGIANSTSPAQIFILDPRKSQNTAIVLRSLAISRQEILDALLEGQGFNAETLEKLTRIAPTKEEESQILEYKGNPTKLADAESFLYHILKAVPSPFSRLDAMLFRLNYDPEILHLKESLQTLELGCKELRTRGLFLKLLEAILKAGNRMNAGTARGNAQAFNLTALRKLSDVKSTDGKTTLLHFVVEEVVRSEGKRCVINRNYSLSRSNSRSSVNSNNATSKEEREREYMLLGLPVVGGLSVEFSNVKKAATIDCDAFINECPALTTRVTEIRKLLAHIDSGRGDGFVREMKGFLESAEEELKVVKEEQTRVTELVKRTTEYYHAGASKDKSALPLQLFVVVKDFLGMVDQVCVDIARNLQKKKTATLNVGSSSPSSSKRRVPVRFPNLPAHFMSDKSRSSSSSDSEDGF